MLMSDLGHPVSSALVMIKLALVECEIIFTVGTREKSIFEVGGHKHGYAITEMCQFANDLWQHAFMRGNYSLATEGIALMVTVSHQ